MSKDYIIRCAICYEEMSEIETRRYFMNPNDDICRACRICLKEASDGINLGYIDFSSLAEDDIIFPKDDDIYYSYLDSSDYEEDITYLDDYRDKEDEDYDK